MLQKAHAGEMGAYFAYGGHIASLKEDSEEFETISEIQLDEWQHHEIIQKILTKLNARRSRSRDTVFTVIGVGLGVLCHVTGWFLPMKGALLIEKIGAAGYVEIMNEAILTGFPDIAMILLGMAAKEEEHREYFLQCLENHEK